MHRALFVLVAAERDSDTSQDARDEVGSGDGAAGGCSQGCRKALPFASFELYRAVVEPERVRRRLRKVVLLRFVLAKSTTRATRLNVPTVRAMNRIGDQRCLRYKS